MGTIPTDKASNKKPTADAELEELEVREVSLVDRPANRRKFLITKRDDGNLSIQREEQEMGNQVKSGQEATTKNTDQGINLLDILGLSIPEIQEPSASVELPGSGEPVEKTAQPQVVKSVTAILARLTKVASQCKGEQKSVPDGVVRELAAVAQVINELASELAGGDPGAEKATKAEGNLEQVVTKAIDMLMKVAEQVKGMDPATEKFPEGVAKALKTVASLLESAAASSGGDKQDAPGQEKAPEQGAEEADKKKEPAKKNAEEVLEVFVSADDPNEIILKAGAKMKKARLNQFRKAVDTLSSLLKELEGGEAEPEKGKETTKKSMGDQDLSEALAGLVGPKLEEFMGKISEQLEGITKRVDDVESGNPGGAGDSDPAESSTPAPTKKSLQPTDPGFWDGAV